MAAVVSNGLEVAKFAFDVLKWTRTQAREDNQVVGIAVQKINGNKIHFRFDRKGNPDLSITYVFEPSGLLEHVLAIDFDSVTCMNECTNLKGEFAAAQQLEQEGRSSLKARACRLLPGFFQLFTTFQGDPISKAEFGRYIKNQETWFEENDMLFEFQKKERRVTIKKTKKRKATN